MKQMSRLGIYGGSFDPFTMGHLIIVKEAAKVFDEVEITVGVNPKKKRLFSQVEAVGLIREAISHELPSDLAARISVTAFAGTLVRYAEKRHATALVRGLRQADDFKDEFVLHGANRMISDLPMAYFICPTEYLHVSSSVVRELATLGEDFSKLVPSNVIEPVRQRYLKNRNGE